MNVIDAITQRHSVRAYLDRPVPAERIRAILDAARHAPSGVNTQPWNVAVVTGETKRRLGEALIAAREAGQAENPDYPYYPDAWREPWAARRKACGLALYRALGIGRGDAEGRKAAWYRNYRFFDAPVGLIFHMDRGFRTGSFLDMGMFMENVMLAALEHDLGTCPQASLAEYPDIVRDVLGLPAEQMIVCGMALGHPDPDAPVNRYRLEREPVDAFTTWHD